MTVNELENILGVTIVGTPQEQRYQALLDIAIDYAKKYCNNPFEDAEGNPAFPTGVKIGFATLIKAFLENPAIQSQTLGPMSKSFFEGGTLKAAHKFLRPYRRIGFI